MSLLPDTGAVELRTCSEYALDQLVERNQRLDRRKLQEIRTPTFIKEETTSNALSANGGAFHPSLLSSVMFSDQYGNCMSCQVHGCFGAPLPHLPSCGRLSVYVTGPFLNNATNNNIINSNNVSLMTSANPHHSTVYDGLKSDDGSLPFLQLEGYLTEVLQNSLNLREWCVIAGEACWILHIHLSLLNVDGSLRSSCLHTCVAALEQLHLPKSRLPNGDIVPEKIIRFDSLPMSFTLAMKRTSEQRNNSNQLASLDDNNGLCVNTGAIKLIADPTALEEYIADGLLVITLNTQGQLVNLLQTSLQPIAPHVLKSAMTQCTRHMEQIHDAISKLH